MNVQKYPIGTVFKDDANEALYRVKAWDAETGTYEMEYKDNIKHAPWYPSMFEWNEREWDEKDIVRP